MSKEGAQSKDKLNNPDSSSESGKTNPLNRAAEALRKNRGRKATDDSGDKGPEPEKEHSESTWSRQRTTETGRGRGARDRGRKQSSKTSKEQVTLSKDKALAIAKVIARFQDIPSQDPVEISSREIEQIKNILVKDGGFSLAEVEKLNVGQIVVEAQRFMRGVEVDLTEEQSQLLPAKVEKAVIEQAKNEAEETLREKEVEKRARVVEKSEHERAVELIQEEQKLPDSVLREEHTEIVSVTGYLAAKSGEKAQAALKAAGSNKQIDLDRWNKEPILGRLKYLTRELEIFPFVEFPENVRLTEAKSASESDIVGQPPMESVPPPPSEITTIPPKYDLKYEDKDYKISVVESEDGKPVIIGTFDLEPALVERYLKKAGYDIELQFPDREVWGELDGEARRLWLENKGVEIRFTHLVTGVRWLDNRDPRLVDTTEVLNRLETLYNDAAAANGITTPTDIRLDDEQLFNDFFETRGWHIDRDELLERLSGRLDIYGNRGGGELDTFADNEYNLSRLTRSYLHPGGGALTLDEEIKKRIFYKNMDRVVPMAEVLTRARYLQSLRSSGSTTFDNNLDALKGYIQKTSKDILDSYDVKNEFKDYRRIYLFVKAFENVEDAAKTGSSGVDIADLDVLISAADRERIRQILRGGPLLSGRVDMTKHFEDLDQELRRNNPKYRDSITVTIEGRAGSSKSSFKYGYISSFEEIEQRIFQQMGMQRDKIPQDYREYANYFATKTYENIEMQILHEGDMGTPATWQDAYVHVLNNVRFAESGDLPLDQLQGVISRIVGCTEVIPTTKVGDADHEKAVKMRQDINELKGAFEGMYILRQRMVDASMDPEQVSGVFKDPRWHDETFKFFFRRFEKDTRGLKFEDETKPLGHAEREFNLLDRAMKLYFKQFREEKIRMNAMERLTVSDLNINTTDADEEWIIRHMINTFRGGTLPPGYNIANATTAEQQYLRENWGGTKNLLRMQNVINEWFRTNTLLGAHGEGDIEMEDPKNLGAMKTFHGGLLQLRRQQLKTELTKQLISYGYDKKKLGGQEVDLIKEFEQVGLLDQVINNAYNMTWTWGAFSDNGIIRIYDKDKTFKDKKGRTQARMGLVSHSKDSNLYFGRIVDYYPEYAVVENRGKPGRDEKTLDANYIVFDHMLGTDRKIEKYDGKNDIYIARRGVVNHNRLTSKIIIDNIQWSDFKNEVVFGGGDFDKLVDQKAKGLYNIDKLKYGDLEDGGRQYDTQWAKGAAVVELMEDGVLSLENIKWSKVFEDDDSNISKFHMIDWWGDRAGMAKFDNQLQQWLQRPNTTDYFKINRELFYSQRETRVKTWHKLFMPAHMELGKYWKKWWKQEYAMPHSEKEDMLDVAVRSNLIEAGDTDWMKEKYLGWGFLPGNFLVRNGREFAEGVYVASLETGKRSWYTMPSSMFGEFWKQLTKYLAGGFS